MRSSMPCFELLPHSRNRRRVSATGACGGATFDRAIEPWGFDLCFRIGLVYPAIALLQDDLEVHSLGFWVGHELEGDRSVNFL